MMRRWIPWWRGYCRTPGCQRRNRWLDTATLRLVRRAQAGAMMLLVFLTPHLQSRLRARRLPQLRSFGIASMRDLGGWRQRWLDSVGDFVFLPRAVDRFETREGDIAPLGAWGRRQGR